MFLLHLTTLATGSTRDVKCADQGSFRACVLEATDYAYCNRRTHVNLQIAIDKSAVRRYDLFSISYSQLPKAVLDDLAQSQLTDDEISDLIGESFRRVAYSYVLKGKSA